IDRRATRADPQAALRRAAASSSAALAGSKQTSVDPVRMYLRRMGAVALLSREGEVEIAKRIEVGEQEVLAVVISSQIAVQEIIELGDKLREGRARLRD